MTRTNSTIQAAKKRKADDFYTQRADIDKELDHYRHHFAGQVAYCNCDSSESNFVKYFQDNCEDLGLNGLHFTAFDFRHEEALALIRRSNIVVTNPPFSLFREFFKLLMKYEKRFVVVAPYTCLHYLDVWPHLKAGRVWLGYNANKISTFDVTDDYADYLVRSGRSHKVVDGRVKGVAHCTWLTNLTHPRSVAGGRDVPFIQTDSVYDPETYPHYDNYNAINVNRVDRIPMDWDGYMGVPTTFLVKHNPLQFELCGIMNTGEANEGIRYPNTKHGRPLINGKEIFTRIIIKRINNGDNNV